MEKINITKSINCKHWNSVLNNSKDTNISLSQQYYESQNHLNDFVRLMAYQKDIPVALLQGKIYKLKNIPLKKLIIGNMSGDGIAILNSKKRQRNTIHKTLIHAAEKEKVDLIEAWSFEKHNMPGYINSKTYTIILKLDKNIEDIWKSLDRRTQNLIKKAQKNKAEIHIEKKPDLKKYYKIYENLTKRAKFTAIDFNSLKISTEKLTNRNVLKIFTAYIDKKIAAFAYILHYKNTIYYSMGASNKQSHDIAASNLLQWNIIKWGIENGCTSYNMWGADPNPSSQSYSVYKFKMNFGGDLIKIYTYRKYINQRAMVLYNLKDTYMKIKEKLKAIR